MFFTRSLGLIVVTAILAILTGCSGNTTPVNPDNTAGLRDNLPIIGLTETQDTFNALGLLGAYEITVNWEDMTIELVAKRLGAIGDSYIVSGISFFTIAPCSNCLRFVGVMRDDDGNGWIKFRISHPFQPGNPDDPPSAINRTDLDVFDLAMLIRPNSETATTFTQSGVSVYNATCAGADGYTTELANFLGDTAALPYFLCVDDTTDADPPVSTWNEFPMGGATTFEVGFTQSDEPFSFDAYFTMGYGHSAVKADRLTPKYYNPEFNRKAAWKVVVDAPEGTTKGTTWDTDNSYVPDVVVSVYDWQIDAPVSTEEDFGNAATDQIYATSDPADITVEVPGMSASLPTATGPDDPAATGMPGDPWVYTISVPHDADPPLEPGIYPGLVTVTDFRVPAGIPPAVTNDYLIDSPDGILLNSYEIDEFVTYQTFRANVVPACGPLDAWIEIEHQGDWVNCPVDIEYMDSIRVHIYHTSENGSPFLREIDWDLDGDFQADWSAYGPGSGISINQSFAPPSSDCPKTYRVAVRVTDSCDPPNVEYFYCDVNVTTCCDGQELLYDWAGCTSGYTCQGWTCGGCGLPNSSGFGYGGRFSWNCQPASSSCSGNLDPPIMNTDYYHMISNCTSFHASNPNFNVVSPAINLPESSDAVIELDYCTNACSDCTFSLYISENGCSGPWISLYSTTVVTPRNICVHIAPIDISSYSDNSNIMFRVQYVGTSSLSGSSPPCGTPGAKIDNVKISGCFSGNLSDS